MSKLSKLNTIFLSLLLVSILSSILLVIACGSPNSSGSQPMQNINVDGIINEDEWADGDWKVSKYIDIDEVGNTTATDGYNYFYLC